MPGVLDSLKQSEICAILAVGGSRRMAALYVGCAVDTIRRTAARDELFAHRLHRAECDFELIQLSNIQQAGKKSWHASAWLLERVRPERFGRRRPATVPVTQLEEVLRSFTAIVAEEVPTRRQCQRLVARMEKMLKKIRADAERKANR